MKDDPHGEGIDKFLILSPGDRYLRLFKSVTPHPHIQVDRRVWNRINASLPDTYLIPDDRIIHLMKNA